MVCKIRSNQLGRGPARPWGGPRAKGAAGHVQGGQEAVKALCGARRPAARVFQFLKCRAAGALGRSRGGAERCGGRGRRWQGGGFSGYRPPAAAAEGGRAAGARRRGRGRGMGRAVRARSGCGGWQAGLGETGQGPAERVAERAGSIPRPSGRPRRCAKLEAGLARSTRRPAHAPGPPLLLAPLPRPPPPLAAPARNSATGRAPTRRASDSGVLFQRSRQPTDAPPATSSLTWGGGVGGAVG
jgi:hypothetical protein